MRAARWRHAVSRKLISRKRSRHGVPVGLPVRFGRRFRIRRQHNPIGRSARE